MRSVGDANGMSNRNTLWQMWRWHLLHLETGSKEIKTRFNITSGKFFFLIKKMTKFSRQEHFLDQDFEFQNIKMTQKYDFRWKIFGENSKNDRKCWFSTKNGIFQSLKFSDLNFFINHSEKDKLIFSKNLLVNVLLV